jgi:hypothetical protein
MTADTVRKAVADASGRPIHAIDDDKPLAWFGLTVQKYRFWQMLTSAAPTMTVMEA